MSGPINKRLLFAAGCLLLLVVWGNVGVVLPVLGVDIEKVEFSRLNCAALSLDVCGERVFVDVHYPEDKVLLCDPDDDGSGGIPYEPCYSSGALDVKQRFVNTLPKKFGSPLVPVKYGPAGDGSRWAMYGFYGDALYRVEGPLGGQPFIDQAVKALFAGSDTLGCCFFPRVEAQQFVNGGWMRLTRMNHGMTVYHLAPADTIQFRVQFVPMQATFLRNRVLVKSVGPGQHDELKFVIQKRDGGYWPAGGSVQEFFKKFRPDTLMAGEWFEIQFPVKPHFSVFNFDVRVMEGDKLHLYLGDIAISGPSMAIIGPRGDNGFSNWPLLPTSSMVKSGILAERGYPNGLLVPRWVAEKCFELGGSFVAANTENAKYYASEFVDFRGNGAPSQNPKSPHAER